MTLRAQHRVCVVALVTAVLALTACSAENQTSGIRDATAPAGAPLQRRWSAPAPRYPQHLAADHAGVVAVGRYGTVRALSARGAAGWRTTVAAEGEQTLGPVGLSARLVVVPVTETRFVALDRTTGRVRWTHEAVGARAAVIGADDVSVLTLSTGRALELLDVATGALRWSVPLVIEPIAVRPQIWLVAHRAVVSWTDGTGSRVEAYDEANGHLAWSVLVPQWSVGPAVTPRGVVFAENHIVHGHLAGARVRALSLATGEERTVTNLPARGMLPTIASASSGSTTVVVDYHGRVSALDAGLGRVRWQRATGLRQVETTPTVVGDAVVVGSFGNGFVGLDLRDGTGVRVPIAIRPGQRLTAFPDQAGVGRRLYVLAAGSRGGGKVWAFSEAGADRKSREGRPLH